MSKVIIFGLSDFASLAHFYLTTDSEHEVVGFSVTDEYMPQGGAIFEGLPVYPLREIQAHWSKEEIKLFAPMSPKKINTLREQIFHDILNLGYEMISYVSSRATTFSNVKVGSNCFILENNTLQPFVQIGDNVVLWSGNHIGHHSTIGDHSFFTSHVVLSGHCTVESNCFLGVNSTIKDGVTLAQGTFVAMAAAIVRSTEPWSIYKGNPAEKSKLSSKDLRN